MKSDSKVEKKEISSGASESKSKEVIEDKKDEESKLVSKEEPKDNTDNTDKTSKPTSTEKKEIKTAEESNNEDT